MTKSLAMALALFGASVLGCGGGPSSSGRATKTSSALMSSAVCTDFIKVITGPVKILTRRRTYATPCVEVYPGTKVTIVADKYHPLDGLDLDDGVDTNPFADPSGTGFTSPQTAILTEEGAYGFLCTVHGDENTGFGMTGVIKVVERP